jgi:TusA-related sulfurtransferase
MNTNKSIILDVSDLEAPYPIMKALDAIHDLKDGETLVFIHRMSPCKLFEAIERNSLKYTIVKDEENYFEMQIYK